MPTSHEVTRFPAPTGFWQREVRLDLVAVAAAVLLLDDVAGPGQVGDDAVGAALGDVELGRDVARADPRVVRDAQQDPGVAGQERPACGGHLSPIRSLKRVASNKLLV